MVWPQGGLTEIFQKETDKTELTKFYGKWREGRAATLGKTMLCSILVDFLLRLFCPGF